jgi:hypothetical protein
VQAALALPAAPALDVCSLDAVAAAVAGLSVGVATVAAGLQIMALMTTMPALLPQSPTPNSVVAFVLGTMVRASASHTHTREAQSLRPVVNLTPVSSPRWYRHGRQKINRRSRISAEALAL